MALLFDELGKMSRNSARDPLPVLLALFDPSQPGFVDQFLPVPVSTKGLMLLGTSNIEDDIPAPLKDRLETIRLAAYTREEQVAIGRGHLLPRLTKGRGMTGRVLQSDRRSSRAWSSTSRRARACAPSSIGWPRCSSAPGATTWGPAGRSG